jgi:hypothetical protein
MFATFKFWKSSRRDSNPKRVRKDRALRPQTSDNVLEDRLEMATGFSPALGIPPGLFSFTPTVSAVRAGMQATVVQRAPVVAPAASGVAGTHFSLVLPASTTTRTRVATGGQRGQRQLHPRQLPQRQRPHRLPGDGHDRDRGQ